LVLGQICCAPRGDISPKEFNVFKPSRRAVVIAASFALGLSCVGPYAHAGLLDGGDSGLPLPVGGELLEGGLLEGLPLGLLGGDLLGDGIPVVGDVLEGGLLGGEDGVLAAEGVVELVPDLSFVPGLGSVSEILEAFSDSGSIVPGLQVLDEFGILGILGSM
jgi:hypothetical protein